MRIRLMELGKSVRAVRLILKSVDFWLFIVSFIASGFTLQKLPTISEQVAAVAAILAICIVISFIFKRNGGWERNPTGVKGVLSAVGVMLFVGYTICMFSVSLAGNRKLELSGTFLEQAQIALADPVVFGGAIPFIFLGIYSAAGYLGLTDTHQLVAQSSV